MHSCGCCSCGHFIDSQWVQIAKKIKMQFTKTEICRQLQQTRQRHRNVASLLKLSAHAFGYVALKTIASVYSFGGRLRLNAQPITLEFNMSAAMALTEFAANIALSYYDAFSLKLWISMILSSLGMLFGNRIERLILLKFCANSLTFQVQLAFTNFWQ